MVQKHLMIQAIPMRKRCALSLYGELAFVVVREDFLGPVCYYRTRSFGETRREGPSYGRP